MKVPVQLSLSLLVIVERVPVGVPLSRVAIVMSSLVNVTAHEPVLGQICSENASVTVALSPIYNSVSDIVNEDTVGARVSTL